MLSPLGAKFRACLVLCDVTASFLTHAPVHTDAHTHAHSLVPAVMRMSVVKQFVTELENVGGSFDRMVITNAKNRTDKAYKTTLG